MHRRHGASRASSAALRIGASGIAAQMHTERLWVRQLGVGRRARVGGTTSDIFIAGRRAPPWLKSHSQRREAS